MTAMNFSANFESDLTSTISKVMYKKILLSPNKKLCPTSYSYNI